MGKWERFLVYPLLVLAVFFTAAGVNPRSGAEDIRERILAREIVLINDRGKPVISLTQDDQRGWIKTLDDEGRVGTMIGSTPLGGRIAVFNRSQEMTVDVFNHLEAGQVQIYDAGKEPAVNIHVADRRGTVETLATEGDGPELWTPEDKE